MKRTILAACLAFGALPASAGVISAVTPTATELVVAADGEVVIYFAGQTAGLDSTLSLISPVSIGPFFPNHATAVGTALSLGVFSAGDILRFRMDVSDGNSFFTGPGAGNIDGLVHVAHATWAADGTIAANGVWVGFEDLRGGGDLDYDDNTFVFTNVRGANVPEPGTAALLGGTALLLGALRRRRQQ